MCGRYKRKSDKQAIATAFKVNDTLANDYTRWLSRDETDQPPIDLLRLFEAEKMTAHLTGNKQDQMFLEPDSK